MDKNISLALKMIGLVVGMTCLTYASFPLYNLFCKVTGYGGTPSRVEQLPEAQHVGNKKITVRFNADTDRRLSWEFKPAQKQLVIVPGEEALAVYRAKNVSDKPITGVATFNVTPDKAGVYFDKIECFCFSEQTLQPGEDVSMPVSFFVDPAIETDPNTKEITTITLSYTFYEK